MRLLITDLDNTLYDWVTFFARSFRAMTEELSRLLDVEQPALLAEFKAIHQECGSSEVPFAALRLPTVIRKYGTLPRHELARRLAPAFEAFDTTRRGCLRLYDGVEATLAGLTSHGIAVVGHTEALGLNAYYRVVVLGIARYFRHLYALEGPLDTHPNPERPRKLSDPPPDFLSLLPPQERKPNPAVLSDICRREGVSPTDACYVGDSIVRDVSMAKAVGAKAVWARYGTEYDQSLWDTLVSVTHWTDGDLQREVELRAQYATVAPDLVIDSFPQLLSVFGLSADEATAGRGLSLERA